MKTAFYLLFIYVGFLGACKSPQSLYNGNVGEWEMSGDAEWSLSSAEIVGESSGGMGFIRTLKSYDDFELSLEFLPDETINSGVFIKCQSTEIDPDVCYEINIWDSNPKTQNRSGSIVRRVPANHEVITINKWNTMSIKSKNGTITAKVNGKKTATLKGDDWLAGHLAFQAGAGGSVRFKNLNIKEL
jgi:hypothetical protein